MRWDIDGHVYFPDGTDEAIDWATVGQFVCERGGGDDYNTAPVSWANMVHANDNPRWPLGTLIQVSVKDTGASDYLWPVFRGQLTEAKWDGIQGVSTYQFRGVEYMFLRRNEGTAANATAGARGTLVTMITSWAGYTSTKMTNRFLPQSQVTLNRPAQGTDELNGEYIRSALYGTSQNFVVRACDYDGAGDMKLLHAPDRIFDYDVAINGPFDPDFWPIVGIYMDSQKVLFVDCGYDTGQVFRKWKIKSTVNSTSATTTASGISSGILDENTVIIDGWYKTNGDCSTTGAMLAERQGSDLARHQCFSVEYRPDTYHDLGGTNSTYLWKLQPGDYFQFDNNPSVDKYNYGTFTHHYDIPAGGSAVTYSIWDVRRVKYTFDPAAGWVYDLGLTPRSTDYFSTGTW